MLLQPFQPSPFSEIGREKWASLAESSFNPLSEDELVHLRGLGDTLDLLEVEQIYLPLSRLLNLYAAGVRRTNDATANFLREPRENTPFVIGIAGSVAVGKSTIARVMRELLARWPDTPRVELVTTDGFLYPNAELERRGLLLRKGYPESYDQRALLKFVTAIKSGVEEVRAPLYSHLSYDIVADAEVVVRKPDILILEGLNVLQPARGNSKLAVSDLFDFSVYVDARADEISEWYIQRFLKLQQSAFSNPDSYFHRFAKLGLDEARETASEIWKNINLPNLNENVLPTRSRAKLVLKKGSDHKVQTVLLRKL